MEHGITFGRFLSEKRTLADISQREFAKRMGLSPVYLCNIEKDRKPAPSPELIAKMIQLLGLKGDDREKFYDLSAVSRVTPTVSDDLPEYIMGNDMARIALRTAKDVDATDEEWQEFISKLTRRTRNAEIPRPGIGDDSE